MKNNFLKIIDRFVHIVDTFMLPYKYKFFGVVILLCVITRICIALNF